MRCAIEDLCNNLVIKYNRTTEQEIELLYKLVDVNSQLSA